MPETIFSKIIAKQIPAKVAYEDEQYIAIYDINAQAPVHLLVIPKKPIPTLNDVEPSDAPLVGGLFLLALRLMREMGYTDYRTVFNCGAAHSKQYFTCTCTCWRAASSHGPPADHVV